MADFVHDQVAAAIGSLKQFAEDGAALRQIAEMGSVCAERLGAGNKILIAGNGGSAADSQHIAAEFVGRLALERRPLPAIALTTDTSILTAIGNDYGFESVFERQIRALGVQGDVFVGISTSGRSANILRAFSAAREKGIITMGLTGAGSDLISLCDHLVRVPSKDTQRIQEIHTLIGHIVCAIAEQACISQNAFPAAARRSL